MTPCPPPPARQRHIAVKTELAAGGAATLSPHVSSIPKMGRTSCSMVLIMTLTVRNKGTAAWIAYKRLQWHSG